MCAWCWPMAQWWSRWSCRLSRSSRGFSETKQPFFSKKACTTDLWGHWPTPGSLTYSTSHRSRVADLIGDHLPISESLTTSELLTYCGSLRFSRIHRPSLGSLAFFEVTDQLWNPWSTPELLTFSRITDLFRGNWTTLGSLAYSGIIQSLNYSRVTDLFGGHWPVPGACWGSGQCSCRTWTGRKASWHRCTPSRTSRRTCRKVLSLIPYL